MARTWILREIASCLTLSFASATVIASPALPESSRGPGGGLRLSLLLDTSASMEEMAQNVRACGVEIVESLGERDLGRIVTFGGKVEVVQEFTASRTDLAEAILGIRRRLGTSSLYNALFLALKYVAGEQPRAIVVISDGKDTSSSVTRDQIEQAAEKETARIYSVVIPTGNRGPRLGGDGFLKSLAESTQGKAFEPQNATALRAACGSMAEELKRLSSIE